MTVTDTTLAGGSVKINDGASGNNTVSAAGDTSASTGKTLSYFTGAGTDSFAGGFENDLVYVSAAAVGGDTPTGGSGANSLILTSAGTIYLGGVQLERGEHSADRSPHWPLTHCVRLRLVGQVYIRRHIAPFAQPLQCVEEREVPPWPRGLKAGRAATGVLAHEQDAAGPVIFTSPSRACGPSFVAVNRAGNSILGQKDIQWIEVYRFERSRQALQPKCLVHVVVPSDVSTLIQRERPGSCSSAPVPMAVIAVPGCPLVAV